MGALPGETVIEQRQGDALAEGIAVAGYYVLDLKEPIEARVTQFRTENRCTLFLELLPAINHGVQQCLGVASLPL
ncbi:hypothetical protein [Mesorhizobium sp.]|uniref:hypothetical protein n=1 Tax=Mesorhizobium sp. TaxID=1871066 RepID=UPI0025D7963A|nr:hypothetical protein [Mesorhizobium sp.]